MKKIKPHQKWCGFYIKDEQSVEPRVMEDKTTKMCKNVIFYQFAIDKFFVGV